MTSQYQQLFRGVTVLITGGAGFIGSHLANRLAQLGSRVRVLDDLSGGFAANLDTGIELRRASILDLAALKDAAQSCRFIFHQAAMVSVPESVENPRKCADVNILGTQNVLEAALAAGTQRVLFAASAAAYGGSPLLPSREDHPPDCCSPYAASKVASEALLAAFARCYPLSTVSLRYFNIFGPRQNPDSPYAAVISAFQKAMSQGKQPTIFGDGLQTRDFTHIDNVVHANLLAASSTTDLKGDVINIGTGVRISLLDVLRHMSEAMGVDGTPRFGPARAGDVKDSVADITKARHILGYEPLVSFAQGIRSMLSSVRQEAGSHG